MNCLICGERANKSGRCLKCSHALSERVLLMHETGTPPWAIAEELGLPRDVVYQRVCRAKRELAKLLRLQAERKGAAA
jgi:DNA-directed RNA polymerase specialized sigma24 family protein